MREICCDEIIKTVRDLCIEAACVLPPELQKRIRDCAGQEQSPVGQGIFGDLIDNVDNTKEPTEDEEPQQSATITVLASPEQARIITELENDGVAHVALISRNNDQLAEELLAEQDKTLQEIYFPETLVDENADAQSSEPAAEGDAENTEGGEPETVSPESGHEDSK